MLVKLLVKLLQLIGLSFWVAVSLIIGQSLAGLLVSNLAITTNNIVASGVMAFFGYAFGIALVIGIPYIFTKKRISLGQFGFDRVPLWSDIGLGVLSFLPYAILSYIVALIGTNIGLIDPNVDQQISFTNLYTKLEYIIAFFTLVVLAPLAEEFLFRGYFLGKAIKIGGKAVGVLVVALVFGSMHLIGVTDDGTISWQWGAAADTFSLGLVAGILRLLTGSIWAGVVLHALKNLIAYYILFIAVAG